MLPVNTDSQGRARAISGTWYLGLIQVLGTGASYLLLAALTRMGPEQYGLWVLVLLLAGYLSPWAGLGLSSALIRHMPAYADRADQLGAYIMARRASLYCSVVVGAVLVLAAESLAGALFTGGQEWKLVVLVALLFPLEAQLQIGYSAFQAREQIGTYALLTGCRQVVDLLLLASLALWLPDLQWMLVARVLVLLAINTVQHLLIKRQFAGVGPANFNSWTELKRFLRFGLPMIPASFIWALIMGVDRFMLDYYGQLAEVGIYNVADMMALFIINYSRPINGVLQSKFANLIDHRPEELRLYLQKAMKFLSIVLVPGAVGMALVAEPVVDLVAGASFARAASIVPFLCFAHLLIGLSNPLYHLVFLARGGVAFLRLYPLCIGLNLVLNVLWIPEHGGVGAAWATMASYGVYVAGLVLMSSREVLWAILSTWSSLLKVVLCSLLMGLLMLGLKQAHPLFEGLLLVPIGLVIFGLLQQAAALIQPDEWRAITAPLTRLLTWGQRMRKLS